MLGGMPPLTPVVRNLIILNVIVFVLDQMIGLNAFAMRVPGATDFYPFQIITHMFMHGGIVHLVMNMLWVAIFGSMVEMVWGAKRFLIFYMVCGLGAIALHMGVVLWQIHGLEQAAAAFEAAPTHGNFINFFVNHASPMGVGLPADAMTQVEKQLMDGDKSIAAELIVNMKQAITMIRDNHSVVGASGCVFGIMVAFAFNFPNAQMSFLFLPFSMSAKTFVLIALVVEIVQGMTNRSGDNVAHFAHLGGALLGTLLILAWYGDLRKLK